METLGTDTWLGEAVDVVRGVAEAPGGVCVAGCVEGSPVWTALGRPVAEPGVAVVAAADDAEGEGEGEGVWVAAARSLRCWMHFSDLARNCTTVSRAASRPSGMGIVLVTRVAHNTGRSLTDTPERSSTWLSGSPSRDPGTPR